MLLKGKSIPRNINILIFFLMIAFIMPSCGSESDNDNMLIALLNQPAYHSPEALEHFLNGINQRYPDITYIEPVGTSLEGRTIWALVISDSPLEFEAEPKIRITGSVHGDENVTTEVLVHIIEHITSGYAGRDPFIQYLVNNRYIVFIPMMNPDGVSNESRLNANNVDLNRNFSIEWLHYSDHGDFPFSEPESASLRDYSNYMGFHLSLTYHSGAVVVNMPFDYDSEHSSGDVPDESDLVNHLALVYSTSGRFLETEGLLSTIYTDEGTINGGDWYIAYGTLQDWSYLDTGCIDLTVEISEDKKPESPQRIQEIFELNKESILSYIEAGGIGVYGRVVDSSDNPVSAEITITGGDVITHSDDFGFYHRILLPGSYTVAFSAGGYNDNIQSINITASLPSKELNIEMVKP